jgi:hypothetical protein
MSGESTAPIAAVLIGKNSIQMKMGGLKMAKDIITFRQLAQLVKIKKELEMIDCNCAELTMSELNAVGIECTNDVLSLGFIRKLVDQELELDSLALA